MADSLKIKANGLSHGVNAGLEIPMRSTYRGILTAIPQAAMFTGTAGAR